MLANSALCRICKDFSFTDFFFPFHIFQYLPFFVLFCPPFTPLVIGQVQKKMGLQYILASDGQMEKKGLNSSYLILMHSDCIEMVVHNNHLTIFGL